MAAAISSFARTDSYKGIETYGYVPYHTDFLEEI